MATAYVFTDDTARDYPWLGRVEPGGIAYFDNRPPDERWRPAPGDGPTPAAAPASQAPAVGVRHADGEARRPNLAAPKEDWQEYAKVDGSFQEATGTHPDEATRKAIVDHYTADTPSEEA